MLCFTGSIDASLNTDPYKRVARCKPWSSYCHTLSVAHRTMLRKALAAALIVTAAAVTKDQSKEKMIEVVKDGRRKLANWIQPKDTRPII